MKFRCFTCKRSFKVALGFVVIVFFLFHLSVVNLWKNQRYLDDFVEGWEYNISRDTRSYILPDNITTLLIPDRFCKKKSDLLIITTSTPSNSEMRTAIRETWGSLKNVNNFTVNMYFIIGQVMNETLQHDISKEFHVYNDLIQEQFIDTYNNLTLKSLMALKLVKTHCADRVKFLMKTDDDMFVNVVPLVKSLKARNPSKVLIGHLIHRASPIRDATSKWNAPVYLYKDEVYPDYLSGTGYVMSFDIVIRLYEASLKTPIYYLEDVYITGILSREINLKPKQHPGFTYAKRKMDACLYEDAITSHHMNESEIRVLYGMIQKVNYKRDCKRRPTTKRKVNSFLGTLGLNSIFN